ncbi:DHS-like NAD/FAD-binding domain-containing protein [Abortiporus biennis]|nr:DHS-like NAD/FAD-binding domain-containing protein [Abortiporus biennis]
MTTFLPLEASSPFPASPSFLTTSPDPTSHLQRVIRSILKSRRIAVVCGAGISVQAGIPDFRSSEGLFHTLKKDNPTLSSGRDLFDVSVFNSENTTSLFCQMIAQLSELSDSAEPTPFHRLLRSLDDRGRLLRVYTQNIDALEAKTGLTFGVPEIDCHKPRSSRNKPDSVAGPSSSSQPSSSGDSSSSRLPTPPAETPRVIPLHGTLQAMHCQICLHSFPLNDHLGSLKEGVPPICPECRDIDITRQAIGKRSRGVGKLRPSVVLYNEMHKDGEQVGEVVRRDLVGSSKGKGRAGPDLLIVVGTSLRVPGTKRIVREFSKAVRSRAAASASPPPPPTSSQGKPSLSQSSTSSTASSSSSTSSPPSRRSPSDEEPPVKTIYLNLDFPVPTREWEGVFDVWVHGDAQSFAELIHAEMDKEEKAKEAALERKKQREEKKEQAAALAAAKLAEDEHNVQQSHNQSPKKRKNPPKSSSAPPSAKKLKVQTSASSKSMAAPSRKKAKSASTIAISTSTSRQHNKGDSHHKLTIRIPPLSYFHYTPNEPGARFKPEVILSPPRGRLASTPVFESPPDSPLTPLPSPRLLCAPGSPISKRNQQQSRGNQSSHIDCDVGMVEYLDGINLSDLSDDSDSDGTLSEPSPAIVRTLQYGLRSPHLPTHS